MSLDHRLCLVVGGARGIGREIATTLREAGATVIATSREEPAPSGATWPLDVTDEGSVQTLAERLRRDHGHLDVLVYNTGIAGPTKPLEAVTEEEWAEVIAVNITGVYRLCGATIPLLRRSATGARIILISSMTGRRPLLHRVPYSMSKSALIGLTRSLALELGPDNITVNTVSPGFVSGSRIDAVIDGQARASGLRADQVRGAFQAQSPLGRLVAPRSVAFIVRMLADSAAADVTGADICVTAGTWME